MRDDPYMAVEWECI
jgi:hypothetical protein